MALRDRIQKVGTVPVQTQAVLLADSVLEALSATGYAIAWGSAAVTGSLTDLITELSEIKWAAAFVKDTNQGAGDAGYVTVNHGADGLLDLYCWDDAGAAATVEATVYWVAIGTPAN